MRTVDFSPLFRSAIGFDRLFELGEAAQRVGEESYPHYNIERLDENHFQNLGGARRLFAGRGGADGRAKRADPRGPEERQGR